MYRVHSKPTAPAEKPICDQYTRPVVNTDTTALVLELFREDELSEYAARQLLDDETVDGFLAETEQSRRAAVTHPSGDEEASVWSDEVPLPYGHLSEEEYYAAH